MTDFNIIDNYWQQFGYEKKDVKSCKYCQRAIVWKEEGGKWVAYDHLIRDRHNDYCHNGDNKFQVNDRIIAFWKKDTIVYDVIMADKKSLMYVIEQPKNSRKRYSSKSFSFKILERVAVKMDKIAGMLYL